MIGFVTCVNESDRDKAYCISAVENGAPIVIKSASALALRPGECVEVSGSDISECTAPAENIASLLSNAIGAASEKLQHQNPYSIGIRAIDEATERMWPNLLAASKLLLRKLFLSAPIIIRFHNDCDGSSGACSLHIALSEISSVIGSGSDPSWIMHRGISYRTEDAESDTLMLNSFSSYEKPLIIIIDFGTSNESNHGIKSLGDSVDIIWLDHHPLQDGAECQKLQHYINPWQFSGDSNYTAGTLASVFASTLSKEDFNEYIYASMIGDYSDYKTEYDEASATSAILDMLTSDPRIIGSSDRISPKELLKALSGKKREELLNFANVTMSEAMDTALKLSKRYGTESGPAIYVLDFEKVRTDSKYPLPGRFSSKLLEKLAANEPHGTIVIVHAGLYISVRSSVSSKELSIKDAMEKLVENKKESVESYGGHEYASSIKVREKESKADVIAALVNYIREMGSGRSSAAV